MKRSAIVRRSLSKARTSKVKAQPLTVGDLITAAFDALGTKHRVIEVLGSNHVSLSVGRKLVFV